ncbi:MAG: ClpXP protease specificity-enhancing factor SspB [Proteobacteria bacterium]|nr:ClpXP protease specificity-enhancing factor SspB [Pseudomonadota bacterium]
MAQDLMQYDVLVEAALRRVVHDALVRVSTRGMPGDHHFYITFRTMDPDVVIPEYLREKYPAEMTIVLQHQYDSLQVDDLGFSISLSFNDKREQLRIPFAALNAFADPSVNFGLQFRSGQSAAADGGPAPESKSGPPSLEPEAPESDNGGDSGEKVVALDQFRRK